MRKCVFKLVNECRVIVIKIEIQSELFTIYVRSDNVIVGDSSRIFGTEFLHRKFQFLMDIV